MHGTKETVELWELWKHIHVLTILLQASGCGSGGDRIPQLWVDNCSSHVMLFGADRHLFWSLSLKMYRRSNLVLFVSRRHDKVARVMVQAARAYGFAKLYHGTSMSFTNVVTVLRSSANVSVDST